MVCLAANAQYKFLPISTGKAVSFAKQYWRTISISQGKPFFSYMILPILDIRLKFS